MPSTVMESCLGQRQASMAKSGQHTLGLKCKQRISLLNGLACCRPLT